MIQDQDIDKNDLNDSSRQTQEVCFLRLMNLKIWSSLSKQLYLDKCLLPSFIGNKNSYVSLFYSSLQKNDWTEV